MLRYPLRQWPLLGAILCLTGLTLVVTVLKPWPLKILVDYALGETAIPAWLLSHAGARALSPRPEVVVIVAAVASLLVFAVNSALEVGLTLAWSAAGQRMVYDLEAALFQRLQRLSLLFHSQHTVGDSLSRLTGDTYCVYALTEALLISPLQYAFTLASIGAVAWKLDRGLMALSLVVAPVMAGSALYFGPRLKQRSRRSREVQSRLVSFVHQTLAAVPVVQAFGSEERNRRQFIQLSEEAVAASQRLTVLDSAHGLMSGVIAAAGSAIVLYAGSLRVVAGELSVGSLLLFLAYLGSLQGAFSGLLGIYGRLKSVEASVDRVLAILDREDGVPDSSAWRWGWAFDRMLESLRAAGGAPDRKGPGQLPAGKHHARGHVRVDGVTFGYQPGRPVLKDVTLEGHPGEVVALVGPTGTGKSTLVSLLLRFFDPWQGRVLLGGVDIRSLQLAKLRSHIAVVLQESFLLPVTVAENIAFGRPGASRAQIEAAAVAANADRFIRQLPQGYDTVLGERGATLSGGQRQCLAIARALLKDAPVLILDEPTAALDAQTEHSLMELLERLMQGRTTFVIAHRLSTIRRADRIVMIQDGEVTEVGTHEELLAAGGRYQRFYALQFAHATVDAAA
jgi:ATP-binding cassette subfamily B protein/subfamily B ATP-binding cassette protein MsbA